MQGYVQAIDKKETSVGTMFDFTISGEKLGAGKFPPKGIEVGDFVSYEIEMRGQYKNLNTKSVRKLPKPAGEAAPLPTASAPAATFSGGRTSDTQKIISRQAASNTAIAWVDILVKADALPIPKAAKSDVRADLMEEVLKTYMNKFHAWNVHEDFDYGKAEDASDPLDLRSLEDKEQWAE